MVKNRPISLQVHRPRNDRGPGILLIHSWWGLTPFFSVYARQLVKAGFVVGLPDLFEGETALTEAEARRLRSKPRRQPLHKTLISAIDELLADDVEGKSIGVAGFSMGGHWAVWLSQRPKLPIAATVLYYAARGGNFGLSRSSYLAHFADNDPWVSRTARRRMEQAIARGNRPYLAFDYPNADHWFAEMDRAEAYDAKAARLALARTIAHFKNTLVKPR
jgi:carboxymethylenebutenolidase